MNALLESYQPHFVIFALVLARIGGVVITAPLLSAVEIPPRFRAAIAVVLALVVAPTQSAAMAPERLTELGVMLGTEALIGLLLGLGVLLVLAAAQMAGTLIAQLSGLSAIEVLDPGSEGSVPLLSRLLHLTALAVYVTIGAHRWLVAGLLDTFAAIPLGAGSVGESVGETLLALVAQSFALSLRIAAPTVVALLAATIALGMISRTLPQLNVLVVGFGVNILATLGVMAVSLGSLAWIFEEELRPAVAAMVDVLTSSVPH